MKNYKMYKGQNLKIDNIIISANTVVNVLQENSTSAVVETVYSNQGTRFQCSLYDLNELNRMVTEDIKLDYSKINNVTVGGIDMEDYGDFCDAYIESADYGDREMSEKELDILNEDSQFVNESVFAQLY
jgi:hypothetical protein